MRLHARSPSPVSALLKDQPGGKQKGGLTPALGSQTGVSPLTSPRNQRKKPREPRQVQPRTRERKNSISEVSDKEEDLLEYHRWQREERMREQEMERLGHSAMSQEVIGTSHLRVQRLDAERAL